MNRPALFLALLALPPVAQAQGLSGSRLTPAMIQNGQALKAGIARLNAQWQASTGSPLVTDEDLREDAATNAAGGPAQPAALPQTKQPGAPQDSAKATQDDFTPAVVNGRYKIPVGYIATGTMELTVNSDNPGPFKGELTRPILSIDRTQVLFPAGSTVIGTITDVSGGANAIINRRIAFVPRYIVRPDGGSMKIQGQDMLDRYGINGIADQTNLHLPTIIGASIALGTIMAIPSVLSNVSQKSNTFNTVVQSGTQEFSQTGQTTFQQYMYLRPTNTVRAGRVPFNIFFNREQYAPAWRERDTFRLTNVGMNTGATQ